MSVRFFQPGKAYQLYKDEYDEAISDVLSRGDLILRNDVDEFEKALADFCGTKYAIGLNSGTDALYLALWAHGIGPGDEVLVPSHTFVATAQVVAQLGAKPVLYDLGGPVSHLVTPNTRAIMPAHIAGKFEGDMNDVMEFAKNHNLIVIEDACQSLGAVQHGKKAGTFGVAGAFSFYPAKILGAFGDAGGLVTNDEWLYNEVKELRNHYKTTGEKWGINSRLDNLQAAVLNLKIARLPETLKRREEIAEIYLNSLTGVGLPPREEGRVWQDFIVTTPKRDELYTYLKEKGIETMKNEYPFPIPKGPRSVQFEKESLRLPINEVLTDEEVMEVINAINDFKS